MGYISAAGLEDDPLAIHLDSKNLVNGLSKSAKVARICVYNKETRDRKVRIPGPQFG